METYVELTLYNAYWFAGILFTASLLLGGTAGWVLRGWRDRRYYKDWQPAPFSEPEPQQEPEPEQDVTMFDDPPLTQRGWDPYPTTRPPALGSLEPTTAKPTPIFQNGNGKEPTTQPPRVRKPH